MRRHCRIYSIVISFPVGRDESVMSRNRRLAGLVVTI